MSGLLLAYSKGKRRNRTEQNREDHNFNFKGKVMDSSSPATPLHPIPSPNPNPSETERRRQPESNCFRCKNQGHWATDCPYKKITTPSSSSLPEILCANGHGPCTAKVSRSHRNPGRIYYACPLQDLNGSKCGFFKWYDQLAPGHHLSLSLSQSDYPLCSCGAGPCRLMLETSQPNAGRLYFICPITKGHGACPFFLWYDSEENTALSAQVGESSLDGSPNSSLNGHLAIQTMNYDLDEKDGLSVEHQNMIMFESAEIDNHQLSPSINSVPLDPLENGENALTLIEEHDGTSNMDTSTNFSNLSIVLRDHHHDLVVHEGGLLNLIMDKIPQVSKQSLPATIHCQQIEFLRENFAAGDTLNGDDVHHQILGFHIFGWLGRLAFPPSECLTVPSSKPLFCCVFPSLDSTLIPKRNYESYSEGLINLPHSPSNSGFLSSPRVPSEHEAQPLSGVLFELSGLNNLLGPSQDSVVTGTIVEALAQAALPIQNLLVTLLESINPLEHESMTWAADCTFASLDHLSVDYTHFSERVTKYISSASSFAEIERSIQNDVSSDEELMEQYHNEIDRFDTISRTHADNVEAFTTSDHRLQSLRKEASQIKEMLLQIENQISFGEAEMSELNTRVADSSKDLIESEKVLQAAAEKAEAAMEQCHQREVIRSAAKAALEEARAQLLQ